MTADPMTAKRLFILLVLALLMAATRVHLFDHFSPPDASWAVFFVGGYYLRRWSYWAFPAFMALAVAVDWHVITDQGIPFWSHYCVSPAYGCLVPAYLVLWLGGSWLARTQPGLDWQGLGKLAAALVAAVVLCQLISQGSFYWSSASVPNPTLAGWWKNYTDWLPPYLVTTATYVAIAAVLHAAFLRLAPAAAARAH